MDIPKDYFVTTDQKASKRYMQEGREAYKHIKTGFIKGINSSLNSMMILQSHKIGLKVIDEKTHTSRLCQSYSDIGFTWKMYASMETAETINNIINKTFTQKSGYKFYLETKLTKKKVEVRGGFTCEGIDCEDDSDKEV